MKKRVALLTCIALVVTTLTACGGLNPYDYVTLPDYSTIPVTVEAVEVTDEEVDAYIETALQGAAVSSEVTEGAIENGDTVNIDYVGKMDGEVFEGGSSAEGGYDLVIGSGSFIDGFEQGLIGVELGATLDLELAFPDPYENNPDYAGKAVTFTVTVNTITRTSIPELTDEVVPTLEATCATVADYKEFVYNTLLEQEETTHTSAIQKSAMVYIQNNSTLKDPPEDLLQEYITTTTKTNEAMITQYMSYFGATREEVLTNYYGTTEEEMAASIETYSKDLATQSLVIRAVAKKEGIKLTEEEINTFATEEATANSFETTEAYLEEVGQNQVEVYLLSMKVYEKIVGYTVVTDTTAEEAAAAAAAADTTTTDTTEEVTAE